MDHRKKTYRKISSIRKFIFSNKFLGAFILGALIGTIFGSWLWQQFHPEIEPQKIVQEVQATRFCGDPISYIRCRGEDLGVSNQEIMKLIRIAKCESNFQPNAKNKTSSATGIFQFLWSTWDANRCEGEKWDYVDNINCAYKVYAKQGDTPWHSSIKCWNK